MLALLYFTNNFLTLILRISPRCKQKQVCMHVSGLFLPLTIRTTDYSYHVIQLESSYTACLQFN